ncbi:MULTISPECIES: DUF1652 domain-containing protein [Pseudomonas syringae group]|uniref:DUF1652 domain-containing protein n=1 Tax=Pseudomonas syringae group TaxID=136849 RepID=UPI00070F3711|nr:MULTISPECIES: DUF1652 domain-containing protein [Pseudomonas syringae group]MCH5508848.1 DUF1652 domain-containing protein [Pseudomonas syringae pv. syringae]MCH5637649.1 DUF1652 domain-containing protein [Pseudomonas syringae pv. syringae]MCH7426782.1 DUF1652 domain-containing protein [Pseudomonas syringae pv. syringae]
MNSQMDLRPCIEAAFLPMKCVCVIAPDASMTIQVFDTSSEAEEFTVTGIDTAALVTIRDIVGLVLEVKGEMRLRRLASDRQQRACKG